TSSASLTVAEESELLVVPICNPRFIAVTHSSGVADVLAEKRIRSSICVQCFSARFRSAARYAALSASTTSTVAARSACFLASSMLLLLFRGPRRLLRRLPLGHRDLVALREPHDEIEERSASKRAM